MEGQQQQTFVMFDLKDTAVFMYKASIHIYILLVKEIE